jgi:hypothetical protein
VTERPADRPVGREARSTSVSPRWRR